MSSERRTRKKPGSTRSEANGQPPQHAARRNRARGASGLAAGTAVAQAQAHASRPRQRAGGRRAQHPRHLRRRHRADGTSAPTTVGLMGYRTPNIDRIAQRRHDLHRLLRRAELHRRPLRRSSPANARFRTGLSKVGLPGATVGLQAKDPTLAELLKPLGYATGQFGKNHLGDRNEFLPTVHGFDEFFGNLYHLNAEEEPEQRDLSAEPRIPRQVRPARRVAAARRADRDDPTEQPRWGRVGKQTIEDTGPLTKKRMETVDDETSAAAIDFMRAPGAGEHAVLLLVQLDPHALPHARARSRIAEPAGPDGEDRVRRRHGRARRACRHSSSRRSTTSASPTTPSSLYTTDNGPHHELLAGRRHDAVPQREEHQLGRRRSACRALIRWPGEIQPGIDLERDRQRARLAADPDGRRRRAGHQGEAAQGPPGRRQDLQGPSRRLQPAPLPHRPAAATARARSSSTSTTTAISSRCATRTGRSSSKSSERPAPCGSGPSRSPSCACPKLFDLRADPYERADITSNTYYDWFISERPYLIFGAQPVVGEVPGDVQGVPTEPACGKLQHRPDRREDAASARSRRTSDVQRRRPEQSRPACVIRQRGSHAFIIATGLARRILLVLTLAVLGVTGRCAQPDPLPSWNDGAAKQSHRRFRRTRHREGGPDYVPPAERIAAFDNDGTLWAEQPVYFQFAFALDRVKALAAAASGMEGAGSRSRPCSRATCRRWPRPGEKGLMRDHGGDACGHDHRGIRAGPSPNGCDSARHPRFNRPYDRARLPADAGAARVSARQRLQDLHRLGRRHRVHARRGRDASTASRPSRWSASSGVTRFEMRADGKPVLVKEPKVEFIDDGPGKPVGINRFIGRRPIFAFGNSDGDQQMLQWTAAGGGPRASWASCTTPTPTANAPTTASRLSAASTRRSTRRTPRGWTIVDMKRDWKKVFAFEP